MRRTDCLSACRSESFSLAMAYVPWQELGAIYEPEEALSRGTLYPALDKPFCGECACANYALKGAEYASDFTVWELRLYLDTHPSDTAALELYKRLRPGEVTETRWIWIDDPWPWEYEANLPARREEHVDV